jgi:hypothetical protein
MARYSETSAYSFSVSDPLAIPSAGGVNLLPGQYYPGIGVRDDRGYGDWIPEAVQFEIISSLEAAKISADTYDARINAETFSDALVPKPRRGAHNIVTIGAVLASSAPRRARAAFLAAREKFGTSMTASWCLRAP